MKGTEVTGPKGPPKSTHPLVDRVGTLLLTVGLPALAAVSCRGDTHSPISAAAEEVKTISQTLIDNAPEAESLRLAGEAKLGSSLRHSMDLVWGIEENSAFLIDQATILSAFRNSGLVDRPATFPHGTQEILDPKLTMFSVAWEGRQAIHYTGLWYDSYGRNDYAQGKAVESLQSLSRILNGVRALPEEQRRAFAATPLGTTAIESLVAGIDTAAKRITESEPLARGETYDGVFSIVGKLTMALSRSLGIIPRSKARKPVES